MEGDCPSPPGRRPARRGTSSVSQVNSELSEQSPYPLSGEETIRLIQGAHDRRTFPDLPLLPYPDTAWLTAGTGQRQAPVPTPCA